MTSEELCQDEKVFKVKFDPLKSELKDIFEYRISRAVWCFYRDSHIVSDKGLVWLNGLCRLLIKDGHPYREKTARKILTVLISNMQSVEYAMHNENPEWVEKVIPYLTGQKTCRMEIMP